MPHFEAGQRLDPNRTSHGAGLAVVIGIPVCKAAERSAMLRRDGPVPGMVRLALWHPDRAGTAPVAGTPPGGGRTAGGHDR
ncbi:MAG: hypothetical protein INF92_10600 [Rhodobacter sp.]|nr:hypothetical protein [Rhodobacter sp.]